MQKREKFIKLKCNKCHELLIVPAKKQGAWIKCKHCKQVIAIPVSGNFVFEKTIEESKE